MIDIREKFPVISFFASVFYLILLVVNWRLIPNGNLYSFLLTLLLIFIAIVSVDTINNFVIKVRDIEKNKEGEVSRVVKSFYYELIDDVIPQIERGEDRHKLNKVTQRMKKFIDKDDL